MLSFATLDGATSYAAATAAQCSLTEGVRLEPAAQGTQVTAVVTAGCDIPKNDPRQIVAARAALAGSPS